MTWTPRCHGIRRSRCCWSPDAVQSCQTCTHSLPIKYTLRPYAAESCPETMVITERLTMQSSGSPTIRTRVCLAFSRHTHQLSCYRQIVTAASRRMLDSRTCALAGSFWLVRKKSQHARSSIPFFDYGNDQSIHCVFKRPLASAVAFGRTKAGASADRLVGS